MYLPLYSPIANWVILLLHNIFVGNNAALRETLQCTVECLRSVVTSTSVGETLGDRNVTRERDAAHRPITARLLVGHKVYIYNFDFITAGLLVGHKLHIQGCEIIRFSITPEKSGLPMVSSQLSLVLSMRRRLRRLRRAENWKPSTSLTPSDPHYLDSSTSVCREKMRWNKLGGTSFSCVI